MNPLQPRSSRGKQVWQDRGRLVPPASRGPSVARTQAVGAAVAANGRLGPLRGAPAGTGLHSTGLGWGAWLESRGLPLLVPSVHGFY